MKSQAHYLLAKINPFGFRETGSDQTFGAVFQVVGGQQAVRRLLRCARSEVSLLSVSGHRDFPQVHNDETEAIISCGNVQQRISNFQRNFLEIQIDCFSKIDAFL